MTETIAITLRLKKELLDKLKKIAREKSFKENKDITYADLIRDATEKIVKKGE